MTMRSLTGAIAIGVAFGLATAGAAPAAETFTGTASVKTTTASATRPITIHVERFLTDAERDKVASVVKTNDNAAVVKLLAGMPDVGYIELGEQKTPIKYAYARSTGAGRMVTVATAVPVLHLGGNEPSAKPKAGYDMALALLVLDANDKGTGEFAPAVKVKVNENGALVTEDYGSDVIRIADASKKQ
jgi:hypothetical protein